MKYRFLMLGLLVLAQCSTLAQPCPPPPQKNIVYVTEEGWHVSIGIPVGELAGPLAYYKQVFPGARIVMFGYGKKTFFTAPPQTFSEYILGPVPGPAVIQAIGLRVTPLEAYPPEDTIVLKLSHEQQRALADYIWDDLVKDNSGKPSIVTPSHDPEGIFYAAHSEYNFFHTCNTWIADALQAAHLPVSGDGVTFSGQTMDRIQGAAEGQCSID